MPIATIQTPDGQVVELEVPEGATEEQIVSFIQSQDLSSFQPQSTLKQPQGEKDAQPQQAGFRDIPEIGAGLGAFQDITNRVTQELIAGVNRGVISLADLPGDVANMIAGSLGMEQDAALLRDNKLIQQGTQGGFIEDPIGRQIVGTVGEFIAPGPPAGALARRAGMIDEAAELSSALARDIPKAMKKPAERAVSSGFGSDIINDIALTNNATRRKIKDMILTAKSGLKSRVVKESQRPSAIAGDSLLGRVNHLKKINNSAGKNIAKVAEKLKGKPVDLNTAEGSFRGQLKEFGIRLADDGKGGFKADFADTSLAPGDRGPIKEIVRQYSRLSKGGIDAADAHELKKIIDRNVTFGKQKTALSREADGLLKDFRVSIDSALDSTYPRYNKANTVYSETRNALDAVQRASGSTLDLTKPSADEALGTSLRRLMGNTQSRGALGDSVNELTDAANKYGGNFEDNLRLLTSLADEFDNKLKTGGSTAFRQQVSQAAKEASVDTAAGQPGISSFVRRMFSDEIDPEKALDSLDELIKRK